MRKHKGYSFINVLGLAIGMSVCMLIVLYVHDELSYDRFHEKADQIYRVARTSDASGRAGARTPPPLAETLMRDFPEVLDATRLWGGQNSLAFGGMRICRADQCFGENRILYADSNFFDVFTLSLLQGNPQTALAQPNTMVITRSMAQKYFGENDPLGQVLSTDYHGDYRITGVSEDVPHNSHFHFDFLASFVTTPFSQGTSWTSGIAYTYLVLQDGYPPEPLEAKLPNLFKTYYSPHLEARGTSFAEWSAAGNGYRFFLQPLTEIHLTSRLASELETNGNGTYVYAFAVIALFTLLIACINFMNLATARGATRAKEVGVRKVLGSPRTQLIKQFLTESLLLSGIALILTLGLVRLALPAFNHLVQKQFALTYLGDSLLLLGLVGFAVLVGLLAGSYPAFFLAAFRPISVLQGRLPRGGQGKRFRNGLVVVQFAVSIVLLVGTGVVYSQMRYVQEKDLGFDKEHVVVVEYGEALGQQLPAFKQALRQNPVVLGASRSNTVFGRWMAAQSIQAEDAPGEQRLIVQPIFADADFVETMGIQLKAGRTFSPDHPTDSLAVLLNEAAIKRLGWENIDPVGKRVRLYDGSFRMVIGVLGDLHFQSLHETIAPFVLFGRDQLFGQRQRLSIRIRPENIEDTMTFLEATWKTFVPDYPFTYSFFDEEFDALYRAEQTTGRLFALFSALALFIACLGMFGLAAFTAEQRTKEIGIRKVLGASVSSLVTLLSASFLRLVGLAFLVATPLAYVAMHLWLQHFAYRVDLSATLFLTAGLAALSIAWLAVGYQSVKTALANPVQSLRYE